MVRFDGIRFARLLTLVLVGVALAATVPSTAAARGFQYEHIAALRSVAEVAVAPDGSAIAYTLDLPRIPGKGEDGSSWRELHVISAPGDIDRVFVGGEVRVSDIRFTTDGRNITYLAKRYGDEHAGVWVIPVDGGESRRLVKFATKVEDYRVSPDGTTIAFIAAEPKEEQRRVAEEQGYSQEIFEEDYQPTRVWLARLQPPKAEVADPSQKALEGKEPWALDIDGSVFHVRWGPDSRMLAVDVAASPLIDDRYMFSKVQIVDAATGARRARFRNQGKLGEFEISPDGKTIAMIAASDPSDPAAGRLMVAPIEGGAVRDLLPGLEGHITHFTWRDARNLVFIAAEGVETRLGGIDLGGLRHRTYATSGTRFSGVRTPIMGDLSLTRDGVRAVVTGNTPAHPDEAFTFSLGKPAATRLTDSNPWLADIELEPQEVFGWKAADGLDLEGLLIRPAAHTEMDPLPLIMVVHGGPEGHRSNGWLTRYLAPAQLAASQGYAVFFPNYRGSTGRGVAFSKLGQKDAAGAEFDDLVDAVKALAELEIIDADRVGVTGGSYGGYATAWLATRYTEHFRAGVMFVGISNNISKGMTTEIPREDIMVHARVPPYTGWQFSLERSPIYWVEKGRTPLLIAGGTADTRVHPAQSLQLYRALKLIGKTPVRFVRYPGEGHGNARAASRDDFARRLMRWMDHFVKEKKADLPPWELEP